MKALIAIAAVLLATSAQAEIIARAANKNGGQMVLTDEPCKTSMPSFKIVTYGRGKTIYGCWGLFKYDAGRIVVLWDDDEETRTYPLDMFVFEGEPPKTPM